MEFLGTEWVYIQVFFYDHNTFHDFLQLLLWLFAAFLAFDAVSKCALFENVTVILLVLPLFPY